MRSTRATRLLAGLLLLSVALPSPAFGLTFRPERIIEDLDVTNVGTLDVGDILTFLRHKGGYLGSDPQYAEAIARASASYGINPQFLIVHIQKESSLIEDANPSQHRLDFALGYGCPDGGTCSESARGFQKQVTLAARAFRSYLDDLRDSGTTVSGWRVGAPKRTGAPSNARDSNDPRWESIDGRQVTVAPQNRATAALFTYTPWVGGHTQTIDGTTRTVGGNKSFWDIWNTYFRRVYPDGSLLRIRGTSQVWLIQNGERRKFVSQSALVANYNLSAILDVRREDVEAFAQGAPIRFANYSLLQAPNGGVYLLVDGTKRAIASRTVFRSIGYNPEEVIKVSWSELAPYPDGEKISSAATGKPQGTLYRIRETGGVYWLDDQNVRHDILSRDVLQAKFRYERPQPITLARTLTSPKGSPVLLPDGTLVTSPHANGIYVISNGQRRPIPSMSTFRAFGFQWKNITKTSDATLEAHELGPTLDLVEV